MRMTLTGNINNCSRMLPLDEWQRIPILNVLTGIHVTLANEINEPYAFQISKMG